MEQKLSDQISQTPKNLKEFISNVQNSLEKKDGIFPVPRKMTTEILDKITKEVQTPFKVRKPVLLNICQLANSIRYIRANMKGIEKRLDEFEKLLDSTTNKNIER